MRIQDTGKLEICIDLVLLDELMLMQDASKLTTSYEYTYLRTLPDMHGPQRRKRVKQISLLTLIYLVLLLLLLYTTLSSFVAS